MAISLAKEAKTKKGILLLSCIFCHFCRDSKKQIKLNGRFERRKKSRDNVLTIKANLPSTPSPLHFNILWLMRVSVCVATNVIFF